jgi:hypothetical protein
MNTRYDMPDNYYFGGGGDTFITPLALAGLLIAIFLILWLPRRHVVAALLGAGILLPSGIEVVLGGLHFPALRLLLSAGALRYLLRRDLKLPPLTVFDKLFLAWACSNAVTFCILWGNFSAVTNRFGFLWSTLGSYLLLRALIRDKSDVIFAIKSLAAVVIVVAPAMAMEHVTRHNLFSILGALELSDVRYNSVRARGPFGHAIIAGTIGAMLMPLFVGLWWQGKRDRLLAGLGILASLTIAIACASSTPIMTIGAGVLGLLLWPMRRNLRVFRWTAVIAIVLLHIVMKAPVWFLVARVGGSLGGSGYHRAMLIDNFIHHFGEWFLVGTQNNAAWGYDMWDVDNAYVAAGIGGGFLTFSLFLAVMVHAFKRVGRSRKLVQKSRTDERLIWALGVSLFANSVGFFGIIYFDQSILAFYCVLAAIAATAAFASEPVRAPVETVPDLVNVEPSLVEAPEAEEASVIPQYSVAMGMIEGPDARLLYSSASSGSAVDGSAVGGSIGTPPDRWKS